MQRPPSIHNEEAWRTSCNEIVALAQKILNGEKDIISGARLIGSYRDRLKVEDDADFNFFLGLDSQTDHLPIGKVEKFWNQQALEQKKAEIKRYETEFKQRAHDACRSLIKKYRP